jgi:hypothetical protein
VTPAFGFPCREDKSPCVKDWQRSTFQWMEWKQAKLVGAQTGERNGFDCLDIDPDGLPWLDENFDALPATYAHDTPRGLHLFFKHVPGLRGSIKRIAPGVDVKADGGYVIWWERQGYAVEDWPLCEWPDWLLEEARAACGPQRNSRNLSSKKSGSGGGGGGVGVTEALRKLDPCGWRGRHDEWFAVLMGAKAAGIAEDDFVEWSIGDPEYADDGEIIRVKWNSVEPRHPGAFFKALKDAGIKLKPQPEDKTFLPAEVPTLTGKRKTISWRARVGTMTSILHGNQIERALFNVACVCAEVHHECGKPALKFAQEMLEASCPRLIKEIGIDEVRRTVANGFRHVEEKFLGERE